MWFRSLMAWSTPVEFTSSWNTSRGGTLAARLAGQHPQLRPPATLVERLARTLAYVHQCGVVHCNLKPRNVLLATASAAETPGGAAHWDGEEVYGIPLVSGFEL